MTGALILSTKPFAKSYSLWPYWLYPNRGDGKPTTFQKKIFDFLTQGRVFEEPTWVSQLVLAFLLWNSALLQTFTAFCILMVFTITSHESPPMTLFIAALTGSMLASRKYYVAAVPLLKMFVLDDFYKKFWNPDSNEDMFSWHVFECFIMFAQYATLDRCAYFSRAILIVSTFLIMLGQYFVGF